MSKSKGWTFDWLPLTVIVSVFPWTDGFIPGHTSIVAQDINAADSYQFNDGFDVHRACEECQILVASIREQETYPRDKASTKAKLSSARESLKQFCTEYLVPVDSDGFDTCNVIADYFFPTKNKPGSSHLYEFCEISGVCDVSGQNSSITESTNILTGRNSSNPKTMELQQQLLWHNNGQVNMTTGRSDAGTSSNLTELLWGRRRGSTTSSNPITFVQISDIHLDKHYEQGTASRCRDKICCRSSTKGSGSAGRFGDYRCDAVKETVDALIASIATLSPTPDFFVYAGDSPPHSNGRDETLAGKLEDNKAVADVLRQTLRSIAPIYPTLGNHDMFPENVYFSRGKRTKSILRELSAEWSDLFPITDEQKEHIEEHGFYTALIRDGLRILSINSLYAYRLNPVAFMSMFDPSALHQHRFIRNTLDQAKSNSEKVILLSHMKPSHVNTYPFYTLAMERLVKEYQDTIVLMLYGHEHSDTFVLSTDPINKGKAMGAFLAAPSVTPYIYYSLGTNPSYRVYTLDKDSMKALDYVQYYVDLKEANDNGVMEVKEHYRFTEEYDLPDLGPQSFKTLVDRINNDWSYYVKFERNKDVLARRRKQCPKWNRFCRRALTCETTCPTKLCFRACIVNPL